MKLQTSKSIPGIKFVQTSAARKMETRLPFISYLAYSRTTPLLLIVLGLTRPTKSEHVARPIEARPHDSNFPVVSLPFVDNDNDQSRAAIFAVSPFLPFSLEDARQPLYWPVHGYPFTYPTATVPPAFLHSLSTPIRGPRQQLVLLTFTISAASPELNVNFVRERSFARKSKGETDRERERERKERGTKRSSNLSGSRPRYSWKRRPGTYKENREDLSVGSCQAAESIIRVTSWYTSVCTYIYIYKYIYIYVMYVVSIRHETRYGGSWSM